MTENTKHSDIVLRNRQRPGYFRINDIILDVSPDNIVIKTIDYNDTIFQARTAAPTTLSSGLRKIAITVSFYVDFEGFLYAGNTGTGGSSKRRLIEKVSSLFIQARKTPIATIDNEKIRKELFGKIETDINKRPNIGVVIDSIAMMPVDGSPSLYRIVLNLSYFNYLPYVGNLEYVDVVSSETDTAIVRSDEPGNLFTSFYTNGVVLPTAGGGTSLINNPLRTKARLTNQDVTILYKEYWALTPEEVAKNLSGIMEMERQGVTSKAEIANDAVYGEWKQGDFHYAHDGDTFYDKQGRSYRLKGIDTAEMDGSNKTLANYQKSVLENLLKDNQFKVRKVGEDLYRRTLVDVVRNDGTNVEEKLIEAGAIPYAGQVKAGNVGGRINVKEQKWKANGAKFIQTDLYKVHGWTPVSNLYQSVNSDVVLQRYKAFVIPGMLTVDQESKASNDLILENISISLRPNSVSIPMQMYSTPTYQFMGGSSGMVRMIIFANPKLDEKGMPYETSDQLAELQRIFHKQSENRIKFSSITKNDCVLIKHPIVSFLKYEPHVICDGDVKPVKYIDAETGKWHDIDYNDFFSCVSDSRESETVNGLPFASRIQIDLREQKLNKRESLTIPLTMDGKDTRKIDKTTRVVELLGELAKRNNIRYTHKKADVTGLGRPGIFELLRADLLPDVSHARRLVELLNTTLLGMSNAEIEEQKDNLLSYMISYHSNNPMSKTEFLETAAKLRGEYLSEETEDALMQSAGDKFDGMAMRKSIKELKKTPLLPAKIKNEIDKNDFLSGETITELVTQILSDASENKDTWGQRYLDIAGPIMKGHIVPPIDLYPDMMLPSGMSPAFYFYNNNLEAELKGRELSRLKHYIYDTESSTLGPFFYSQESASIMEKNLKKKENTFKKSFGGAMAIPSATDGGKDKSLVNRDFDPLNRFVGNISSSSHMSTSITGMDRSTPAFKIFLIHQDEFTIDRNVTTADKSQKEVAKARTNLLEISDFYDLGCVAGFRLIKSEETPVDLLVIQIASPDFPTFNVAPNTMSSEELLDLVKRKTSIKKVSQMEEKFAARGLTEGTKIQLRLGYDTDPNSLTVEFNGRIMSVSGEDVLEVVAVGDGYELVQEPKGMDGESDSVYKMHSNTPKLIRELLRNSPELVSFGRLNPKFMDLELPFIPGYFGGRTVTDNIFAPLLFTSVLKGDEWEGDLQQWAFISSVDAVGELLENAGLASAIGSFTSIARATKYVPRALSATGRALGTGAEFIGKAVPKNLWLRSATLPIRLGARTGVGLASFVAKMSAKLAARTGVGLFGSPIAAAAMLILTVWDIGSGAFGMFKKAFYGSPFAVRGMTIWDVLQELTLRHPGTICSVVPFGNRSTIFFGEPHQNFFYRPPTPEEMGMLTTSRIYGNSESMDLAEFEAQGNLKASEDRDLFNDREKRMESKSWRLRD